MELNNNFALIDLFCCAGGSSKGYENAGFEVIAGFDIEPQPHYLWPFHQGDWREGIRMVKDLSEVIPLLVHASPPCQRYSTMTKRWEGQPEKHPDLVNEVREELKSLGVPYVIENVMGAPLQNPVKLCGSMFGLQVRRHRLFETSFPVKQPSCKHKEQGPIIGVYGHAGGKSTRNGITFGSTADWKKAMGIDWMTGKEMAEALPPAYTEYIGKQFLNYINILTFGQRYGQPASILKASK